MGRIAVNYLFKALSVVFGGLLLALSVMSWRASFISPASGELWTSLALLMPVILFVNFLLLLWWLIRRRWFSAVIPLAAILFNWEYIGSMIRLPHKTPQAATVDIRIATLNVGMFRRLGNLEVTARAVDQLMTRERVDVLCLQEFGSSSTFPPAQISELFSVNMPSFVSEGSQAIASRFPIVAHRYVRFPQTNNDYLWADLKVGSDTVRVLSVHLQTSGITSLRRRFRKYYNRDIPVDRVFDELESNSRIRAEQVATIRDLIDTTRYPVVVAGDFNDTPSSYTYRMLKGDFTDGFRESGQGFGGTFRYIGGLLRIDYILYDARLKSTDYRILPEDVSDHKAVVADLQLVR